MSLLRVAGAAAMGVAVLTGCQEADPYGPFHLGPARDVVADCVDAMGGLRAWQGVGEVRAAAVATWYDASGRAFADRFRVRFDLRGGTVRAEGATPRGDWRAVVNDDGELTSAAGLDATIVGPQRTAETLAVLLHRVRGPLNLLGRRERVHAAGEVKVDGERMTRVSVDGDNRQAIAYYFDRQSNLLRMVSSGADAPGREGTVTLYQYAHGPDGRAFPSKVRLVRIGQHVLVGEEPVVEVAFSEVEID